MRSSPRSSPSSSSSSPRSDDDGDGDIDLCDTPDVVVVANGAESHVYVLNGATGAELMKFAEQVDPWFTPAIGDIDGDGLPEVVAAVYDGRLIAFEHDGAVKWLGNYQLPYELIHAGSVALADLDADGDVEIVVGDAVFDHLGQYGWRAFAPVGLYPATTAADLDGDGDLEVVTGSSAYHHDGTLYYEAPILPGFPQVANLDDDPDPEVLVTSRGGISLLEHDGTIVYEEIRPTGASSARLEWLRPAAVHDFDGDGVADYAQSSASEYVVYAADGSIVWRAPISDTSGIAGSTAFDFLGDGVAEAMYADETQMFVFDGAGAPLLQIPRTSTTMIEYPVVADIDNDGSAEIVVTSNWIHGHETPPTVQVIRDREDRWIQARRIWNQHT